jgi:hypothetical protein
MKKIFYLAMLALACVSCDDETQGLGLISNSDVLTISDTLLYAKSSSVSAGATIARSSTCYLGRVTDPETNSTVTAEFLTQFYCKDNFNFLSYLEDTTNVRVTAARLGLYYDSFYGDSLAPMKVSVYELDPTNVMQGNTYYYTDLDPLTYLPGGVLPAQPLASAVYTLDDQTVSEDDKNTSGYVKYINIPLPKSFGERIYKANFDNPSYFTNSYTFAKNVCPGFYFKLEAGDGCMAYISDVVMDITVTRADTAYTAIRFAATPEVVQTNVVRNDEETVNELLANEECTYMKTPAGIYTEVELPVKEICGGTHANDEINSVKVVFDRAFNETSSDYDLALPYTILMIRKSKMEAFFADNKTVDTDEAIYTTISSNDSTYTFNNIATIVKAMKQERAEGVAANTNWEQENPDWNKVVMIPVVRTYDSSSNLISVNPSLAMSSTKLVRGKDNEIALQVIYSRYK